MYQLGVFFTILIFAAYKAQALTQAEIDETRRGIVDQILPQLVRAIISIDESASRKVLTSGLTSGFGSVIADARTETLIGQVIAEFAIAIDLSQDSNIAKEVREVFLGYSSKDVSLVGKIAQAIASVTSEEIAGQIRSAIPK